jgi:hypothetical protein
MSTTVQRYLEKLQLFRKLASFREESVLVKGVNVSRPFRSGFVSEDYVANTDVTASDTSLTASTLTVNNNKAVRINVDPTEDIQLQTNPDSLRALYSPRMAYILTDLLDRDYFDEVDNAGLTLDESNFLSASASGDAIDLDVVPAEDVWLDAFAELGGNNIGAGGKYAVIDHKMAAAITKRQIGGGFTLADQAFSNGFTGTNRFGFDMYISENLPTTQAFTLLTATQNNTFTIKGVVFTAKDALGTTAGNVYTNSGTLDTWGTNLAKAISGATPSTFYVEVSADKRDRIRTQGLSASYDTGTNVLTVTSYGRFRVTATASSLTAGEQTVKAMCGQYGAIDMVVQMNPTMQFNKAEGNLGSVLIGHTLWGTKTFEDGAQRLLKLSIKG